MDIAHLDPSPLPIIIPHRPAIFEQRFLERPVRLPGTPAGARASLAPHIANGVPRGLSFKRRPILLE